MVSLQHYSSQSLYSSGLLSHCSGERSVGKGLQRSLNPFIHQVFFPTFIFPQIVATRNKVSIPLFIRSSFPQKGKIGGRKVKEQSQSLYSSGLLSHLNLKMLLYLKVRCLNPFIHQVFFPTIPHRFRRCRIISTSQSLYSSGLLSHIRKGRANQIQQLESQSLYSSGLLSHLHFLKDGNSLKTSRSQSLYSSGLLSHIFSDRNFCICPLRVSIPLFIRSSFPPGILCRVEFQQ